jgi:hydrogenase nickel incorporation protein HypA/HybF
LHELGIAEEILGIVLAEAERNQAKKVSAIRLRVGVVRAIEPEQLTFIFDHIARKTLAEGASLEIEEVPVRVAARRAAKWNPVPLPGNARNARDTRSPCRGATPSRSFPST